MDRRLTQTPYRCLLIVINQLRRELVQFQLIADPLDF